MSDQTDRAIAEIRAALDAGPTPGEWVAFHKHKYDEWHVSVPLSRGAMRLALFIDGCPTERPQADAEYIAACHPENLRALLAKLERLRTALHDCDVIARARGDKYGLCDQIDNSGSPYQSQWLADLMRPADAERSKE